jgi:hypothetical protein
MNDDNYDLKDMKVAIEKIEQQTLKLMASGTGLPVVEKNARIIMSAVHNLRFGIVDPAVVTDQ